MADDEVVNLDEEDLTGEDLENAIRARLMNELKRRVQDSKNEPGYEWDENKHPEIDNAIYKQLKRLSFDNQNRFFENWNPESSNRETRKLARKFYARQISSRKNLVHDEKGILIKANKDVCDCLIPECPGCHFPCPQCSSRKCGHECRCCRKWSYERIEVEGTSRVRKNPFK